MAEDLREVALGADIDVDGVHSGDDTLIAEDEGVVGAGVKVGAVEGVVVVEDL